MGEERVYTRPAAQALQLLGGFATWTTLRGIGVSNLARLTILMPFIGYLIVFNSPVFDFVYSNLPAYASEGDNNLTSLHSRRLEFLYFGLLFIGLGVSLFSIRCPDPIKNFENASEYIGEMESVASPLLTKSRLEDTLLRFVRHNRGEQRHPLFGRQSASFPCAPSTHLHEILARVYRTLPADGIPGDIRGSEQEGSLMRASGFLLQTANGPIRTDELINIFFSGRTVDTILKHNLLEAATADSKEIFYLDYDSLRYCRFYSRLIVAGFFWLGFALLAVPTVTTSLLVAKQTFG